MLEFCPNNPSMCYFRASFDGVNTFINIVLVHLKVSSNI